MGKVNALTARKLSVVLLQNEFFIIKIQLIFTGQRYAISGLSHQK
jgi:hypothetical protein